MNMLVAGVVLAAGVGKRFQSPLPKVFHPLLGRKMVVYPIRALQEAGASRILVVIQKGWEKWLEPDAPGVEIVYQPKVTGTAEAVLMTQPHLHNFRGLLLVINGDVPLITPQTLKAFIQDYMVRKLSASFIAVKVENPAGYGRVLLSPRGEFLQIVEEAHLTQKQKREKRVNGGVYLFPAPEIFPCLQKVPRHPITGEAYLPEVLTMLKQKGKKVGVFETLNKEEVLGINTRRDFGHAIRILRQRVNEKWMLAGVTLEDPDSTFIDIDAEIQPDAIIKPFVVIEGNTKIQRGAVIGPFAHIRPQTVIGPGAHIGNFVEVKNSRIGAETKASHHAYLGDATIGKGVNIGAGTITCNYDGFQKYPTTIEEGAFIGSDSILVAPLKIGKSAYTAAGSVLTRNVPPFALAISRARERHISRWVTGRKRKKAQKK